MSASSTARDSRLEFALRHDRAYLLDRGTYRSAVEGAEAPRLYDLLLALAVRPDPTAPTRFDAIRRDLVGAPAPPSVQKLAAKLVELRLATTAGKGAVALRFGRSAIAPDLAGLVEARARYQRLLALDPRLTKQELRGQALANAVERAFEHEQIEQGMKLIGSRVEDQTFVTRLVRHVSPALRDAIRLEAYGRSATLAMNRMNLDLAADHLARAFEVLRAGNVVPGTWPVRLKAAEAGMEKMRALLLIDEGERLAALRRSERAWAEAAGRARELPADLSEATRSEMLRWTSAERVTPLSVLAGLARQAGRMAEVAALTKTARACLAMAREARERCGEPENGLPLILFMELRLALALGDVAGARRFLAEAEENLRRPTAPEWIRGWLPRYRADVAFASGASEAEVWEALRAAWEKNHAWSFQPMLILVRVGMYGVRAISERKGELEPMMELAEVLHRDRRGTKFAQCETCRAENASACNRSASGRSLTVRCARPTNPSSWILSRRSVTLSPVRLRWSRSSPPRTKRSAYCARRTRRSGTSFRC